MRFATFFDAGYLYAAGASAITGHGRTNRTNMELGHRNMVDKLEDIAKSLASEVSLLRTYWYDGILLGRRSRAQQELATADNVKVRLGTVSGGRQEGVDSLIVTDLIELARNHAISEVILLSGDEDVRVGVQIAQSFGVRVHLIGTEPSRSNQAYLLREEADTNREISRADVAEFLSIRVQPEQEAESQTHLPRGAADITLPDTDELLQQTAAHVAQGIRDDQLLRVAEDIQLQPNWIPNEYDSQLLGASRAAVGRDLTQSERDLVCTAFREVVQILNE